MALFGMPKRKGLFGNPYKEPPMGTPPINPDPRSQPVGTPGMGFPQQMEPERKPGFFGQGRPGQYVLAGLSDFVARRMNEQPTAIAGLQQQNAMQQQAAAAAQAAELKRAQDLADWRYKQEWERDNPKPVNNDTINDYEFWKNNLTPEQFQQYLQNNVINPTFFTGEDGRRYANPTMNRPAIGAVVPDPRKGGPVSNGGDGFRSGVSGFRGLSGERITSTFRDPQKNKTVGGVPNSYHMRRFADGTAMARDSVPPPGMSMEAYAAELRRLNPDMEVINEGDHVHMEPK